MRTKLSLLAILTAVLLAFGGTAVAQDYGTETDPQDTTTATGTMDGDLDRQNDLDADVEADAELNVQADNDLENDELANDEFGDDEQLPRTASFLPALGALGLMSLAGGAALRGRKS